MRDCCFAAQGLLDEVHSSHAAHVVGVAHKFSSWGVEADFAAVSSHPAALGFTRTWSFPFLARTIGVVVVDTVVVLAQHGQVRGFGVSAVFVGVDVVDLASICWNFAVRPRTHQFFLHGQGS